jgi:hypothetical protein
MSAAWDAQRRPVEHRRERHVPHHVTRALPRRAGEAGEEAPAPHRLDPRVRPLGGAHHEEHGRRRRAAHVGQDLADPVARHRHEHEIPRIVRPEPLREPYPGERPRAGARVLEDDALARELLPPPAAREQRHLVPGSGEPRAVEAADHPRAVDQDAHASSRPGS